MNQDNEEKNLIGFMSLYETPNHDGYIGAILITDIYGVPKEFRCTHPVKPTSIQKQLYGNTLEPHISVNLCGIPLVGSINCKPSVLVVDKKYLLDVRQQCNYPVIYVRRAGEAIEISTSTDTTKSSSGQQRERLDCPTGRFQPVVFEPHPDFNDDRAFARSVIEKVFKQLDPIEPFQRIIRALEILGTQDTRFQ